MKSIIYTILILLCNNLFSQNIIEMQKVNNVFVIPCKINGVPMNFIFDTGASDVSISLTEAKFLFKNGLLNDNDIKENQKYTIANGELIEGTKINLKVIEIGDKILENVTATIIHQENSPLLLGQSAISKLGNYSIKDNKLIFGNIENDTILKKSTSILDEKYGYRNINLDTEISEFENLKLIGKGSNNSGNIYDYSPIEKDILNLFYVDFHKLLLGFDNSNNKLEVIILLKRYKSNNSSSIEETQNKAFNEYENLLSNFYKLLGKPTNIKNNKNDDIFNSYWEGENVILNLQCKIDDFILGENGNVNVKISTTVTFSKKQVKNGF